MQLRTARLCLDCEEVHDGVQCPRCASETYTFLTRWIPADDRRRRPRAEAPDVEVYRQLTAEGGPSRVPSLLKRGLLGLAAVGVAGWVWRSTEGPRNRHSAKTVPPE